MGTVFLNVIQFVLGLSVVYVWVFRFDNVAKEFKQFGLSDITRNFVGTSKIAVSTLLIAGVWHPSLVQISAVFMGLFMIAAQYFHFKIKNPFSKHLPSLILLILSAIIAVGSTQSF
ncbi:DoxX family protein [Flavobacterium lacus]|uniref:DoxX-like protein n=1 Tax=Flavobacterium lacus TaxID=1353778 RepID=A0A328X6H8_9FLAO|nr:DoxX family protein [Flavobacterium lacus]RAR50938.1 DoxX-like protein [Flavobacterium lacus]